jgi:hypothetical protein
MPDSTLCPAAIVPLTANMQNWKSTDSTGLRRKMIQSVHGSTTLEKAAGLFIGKSVVRNKWQPPFGVSKIELSAGA